MSSKITPISGITLKKIGPNESFSTGKIPFKVNGIPHEVEVRETPEHESRPWSFHRNSSRAYVWSSIADIPTTDLEDLAKAEGLDSIYGVRGENTRMDQAWKKFNKAEVRAETEVLKAAIEALNLDISFRFSRTAGCKCGCSPGFIITDGLEGWVEMYVNEVKKTSAPKINRVFMTLDEE